MRQPELFKFPPKPWNAGRIIGPKAPLKPKHIWSIRQQLKTSRRTRDLALFNCALDAKLRACDMVKLRVSDMAPGGVPAAIDRDSAEDGQAGAVRDHGCYERGSGRLAGVPRAPG